MLFNRIRSKDRSGTCTFVRSVSIFSIEILEDRRLLSVTWAQCLSSGAALERPGFQLSRLGGVLQSHGSSAIVGLTAAKMRHAYGIDAVSFSGITGDGSGQTIAIVDAYDEPTILSDLSAFDA